jgi:hypothetical protein
MGWGFTILYTGALLLALAAVPATAADYSPWTDRPSFAIETLTELAQQQDRCCKHCTKGQPCGNTCISAKAKCKSPPGCAW